jgi:hypothetical protein
MAALLVFLGSDRLLAPNAEVGRALVDSFGDCLPHIDFVVGAPSATGCTANELRAQLPTAIAARLVGSIWDRPPPRPLGAFELIQYWLARAYVRMPAAWLAIGHELQGWPAQERRRLIALSDPIDPRHFRAAVQEVLSRYEWSELWWGSGAAPSIADRRRLQSLMCIWSVPTRHWPVLMGNTRAEFRERLDLLLTIHAGVSLRSATEHWWPHWVQLPQAELDMRRPLKVMMDEGVDGIRRVCDLVWCLRGGT